MRENRDIVMETERLTLRHWKESDLVPFAKMNANPKVMEFFPKTLSLEESNAFAGKIQKELKETPYGLWAVEVKKKASFIGFIGLHYQDFEADFTPCIEIGWRLDNNFWGKGYAFEGASAVLEYAFNTLGLKEVVSFTAKVNLRSIHLMKKIGLKNDPKDNFLHSKLEDGDPLKPHVLYRLKEQDWNG